MLTKEILIDNIPQHTNRRNTICLKKERKKDRLSTLTPDSCSN
jgi:hypothetical protein